VLWSFSMTRFALVCLGGALGSGARYLMSTAALRLLGPAFPWGTLTVNLLGSFLIVLIMHLGLTTTLVAPELRLFLTTGIMGGLTTYSTFSYETLRYVQDGAPFMAVLNVLVTLVGCFLASVLGLLVGRVLAGS
jgi:CrcB protein